MTSRFLVGATMLAVITGTAVAQRVGERAQMFERLRERAAQRQTGRHPCSLPCTEAEVMRISSRMTRNTV